MYLLEPEQAESTKHSDADIRLNPAGENHKLMKHNGSSAWDVLQLQLTLS